MFKANERCYNRTFGLYGLEALNHRSELKILWDTFRSQIAELWFPYDRRIANDRRRSQTIAEDRTMIARSQAIAEVCFHMIADDRRTFCDLRSAICDPRSSAIIWKPALKSRPPKTRKSRKVTKLLFNNFPGKNGVIFIQAIKISRKNREVRCHH